MISWLKGETIEHWRHGARVGVILNCSGIGYEIQLLSRNLKLLNGSNILTLWIHHVQREDGSTLIGFIDRADRDVFRKLISVSGVGTQLAIALLEANHAKKLVLAIVQKDSAHLTKSPGVGKRTAERLIIELNNKLSEFIKDEVDLQQKSCSSLDEDINSEIIDEVKSALLNIDYKDSEIETALKSLSIKLRSTKSGKEKKVTKPKSLDFETLLKETLVLINKETG
ncbi:Holliday junction branch migration protein RuvA [Prochlorococcus marinus]|uniref:Holliday junction branch migration protein RuvA n=1 Tax=Prochlorococcus marinus TaxID=1219 RepID=UPI0022B4AA89|nr:Holliday junction branch migration protein RuvA [Prochlorococcus marinus]